MGKEQGGHLRGKKMLVWDKDMLCLCYAQCEPCTLIQHSAHL